MRLLEAGCDINKLVETTTKGRVIHMTALCRTIGRNQEAAAQLLLDRGADPNLADSDGYTPLMAAVSRGSLPLVQKLAEPSEDQPRPLTAGGDGVE